MPVVERFEDLKAWQKSRELTKLIYELSSGGNWAKDFGLRDQIRRASVSVMSNIAEGFERRGGAEFGRFLDMAKGSAGEVRCQLYVALDLGYADEEAFNQARGMAEEISRMVAGLASYLRKRPRNTVPSGG